MAQGRDYLGSYRLVRLIRAGQTCQVWEAINDLDNSRVALKALQPEVRNDRIEISYLKHEFEVGKNLNHENVIHIYGFYTDHQIPFLAMELSRGKNMKLELRQGAQQLAHMAPRIVDQCAAGLEYLHAQGWLHRDIKPDNFLINPDGTVKLIDFAIAQKLQRGLARLLPGRSKVVQGTRSYMSPEQIRGVSLDERSDIYSFGCLLFELLSGKPPYAAATPEELLKKHLRAAAPSLAAVNHNITVDCDAIIRRMMAKEAKDRPNQMSDVRRVLKSIRLFKVSPKPPAAPAATGEEEN